MGRVYHLIIDSCTHTQIVVNSHTRYIYICMYFEGHLLFSVNSSMAAMNDESYMKKFNSTFSQMRDQLTWRLKSGRCVEDILYTYGRKLKKEELVHSFILEVDNPAIQILFNTEEWKEINMTKVKESPPIPDYIRVPTYDLDKKTVEDVNESLHRHTEVTINLKKEESYEVDWICHAVKTFLCHLGSPTNPLESCQTEEWYTKSIWAPLMKTLFDDVDGIECKVDDSTNMKVASSSIVEPSLEFIAIKASSSEEEIIRLMDCHGFKIELPKRLRSMLGELCQHAKWRDYLIRDIEVIGCAHNGLAMDFLRMDHPAGYICRLQRFPNFRMPSNIKYLTQALELLIMLYKMKARTKKTFQLVSQPCSSNLQTLVECLSERIFGPTILLG
ncbi:hypothetical protein BDB01DRAFT_807387 [Pilobolus umbonatus]|nr:hypothetical protein BDB01DRAFT_807387 [Pilobolus umbonatus]